VVVPRAWLTHHGPANERTFLAYIRTANTFALFGVLNAQLFRLNKSPLPGAAFNFYDVGVPLACCCYMVAILLTVIGMLKYLRCQNLMAQGMALAGGWEILTAGGVALLVSKRFLIIYHLRPAMMVSIADRYTGHNDCFRACYSTWY